MGLFGKKKSGVRIMRIPQNKKQTVFIPNKTKGGKKPCCGGRGETMRNETQMLSMSNGYSVSLPKQGVVEFEWENTNTEAVEIVIFDALAGVQKALSKPSLPTGVDRVSIRKEYQDILNALVAGESYKMGRIEYTVISGSTSQVNNPVFAHVANHFTDEQTQIGEFTPAHRMDRANQRHLDYASIPVNFWVDPRFALVHRLEPRTKIRLRFEFSHMLGSDR